MVDLRNVHISAINLVIWRKRTVQNAPDLLPEYEATVGSFLKMYKPLQTQLGLFRELVKSQFSPISQDSQAASPLLLLSFQSLADGPPRAPGVACGVARRGAYDQGEGYGKGD